MPKGGSRARAGRPAEEDSLNRDRVEGDWTILPASGRPGPVPKWPLDGGPTAREKVLWKRMWSKPQAVMWEKLELVEEVAHYVRRFTEAEKPGSPVNVGTLVRQMSDSLGLTVPGLRFNRWKIEVEPEKQHNVETTSPSARDRLKAV